MSDKTELPKEDKQLISKIDELLGQLKTISQSVFELREHASLVLPDVAPVDTKEEVVQKYFDCVLECVEKRATIIKEEVKERWQPSYGCKYWYIGSNDGQFFVSDFHWGNDDVDFTNYDTGNCFKTEQEAQSAATHIKNYLTSLQF